MYAITHCSHSLPFFRMNRAMQVEGNSTCHLVLDIVNVLLMSEANMRLTKLDLPRQ